MFARGAMAGHRYHNERCRPDRVTANSCPHNKLHHVIGRGVRWGSHRIVLLTRRTCGYGKESSSKGASTKEGAAICESTRSMVTAWSSFSWESRWPAP